MRCYLSEPAYHAADTVLLQLTHAPLAYALGVCSALKHRRILCAPGKQLDCCMYKQWPLTYEPSLI